MSDEIREAMSFGWNVFSAILGAILTLVIHAFRFGGTLKSLATRDELERYVTKEQFNEYKADTKEDFARIEDQLTETRTEIIKVIRETR